MVSHLLYRERYDWSAVLGHFAARALAPVDAVKGDVYRRHVGAGVLTVSHEPSQQRLTVASDGVAPADVADGVARVGAMFHVAADLAAVRAGLSTDPAMAPLLATHSGLRIPGGWDAFELGVRAILGQQVSVAAARKLGQAFISCAGGRQGEFPTAAQTLAADLTAMPMPGARKRALLALAEAAQDGDWAAPEATVEATVAKLQRIRGVGPWTAHYIALRASREPDAFPAADAALLRTAERLGLATRDAKALTRRAERWRPWRSYAAQLLWLEDSGG